MGCCESRQTKTDDSPILPGKDRECREACLSLFLVCCAKPRNPLEQKQIVQTEQIEHTVVNSEETVQWPPGWKPRPISKEKCFIHA